MFENMVLSLLLSTGILPSSITDTEKFPAVGLLLLSFASSTTFSFSLLP
jgi:hypothetical protein